MRVTAPEDAFCTTPRSRSSPDGRPRRHRPRSVRTPSGPRASFCSRVGRCLGSRGSPAGTTPADRASFAGAFTYSITSSASICIEIGTSIPSALAVFMLMTSSNLVGTCTGSSPLAGKHGRDVDLLSMHADAAAGGDEDVAVVEGVIASTASRCCATTRVRRPGSGAFKDAITVKSGRTRSTGEYKHNHYVPVWYQRRFMLPGQDRYFRLDLKPEVAKDATIAYTRKALHEWSPARIFAQNAFAAMARERCDGVVVHASTLTSRSHSALEPMLAPWETIFQGTTYF
jgi:hypothetical protein